MLFIHSLNLHDENIIKQSVRCTWLHKSRRINEFFAWLEAGPSSSLFSFLLSFFFLREKSIDPRINWPTSRLVISRGAYIECRGSHVDATKLESSRWPLRILYLDPQQPFNSHSPPLIFSSAISPPILISDTFYRSIKKLFSFFWRGRSDRCGNSILLKYRFLNSFLHEGWNNCGMVRFLLIRSSYILVGQRERGILFSKCFRGLWNTGKWD